MPPSAAFALHTDLMLKSYVSKAVACRKACAARRRSSPCPFAAHVRALAQNAPLNRLPARQPGDRSCHVSSRRSSPSGESPFPTLFRRPQGGPRAARSRAPDRAVDRRYHGPAQSVERPRFYNALQDRNWDTFVNELLYFCGACDGVHHPRRLSALPQPMAADPLAALHDGAVPQCLADGGNHYRMQLSRRRSRQSGPAHRRRHQACSSNARCRSASVC